MQQPPRKSASSRENARGGKGEEETLLMRDSYLIETVEETANWVLNIHERSSLSSCFEVEDD